MADGSPPSDDDHAGDPIPRVEADADTDTIRVVVRDWMHLSTVRGATVLSRPYPDLWTYVYGETRGGETNTDTDTDADADADADAGGADDSGDGDGNGDGNGDDPTIRVRVGTAAHVGDCEGWFIHGANGLYADRELRERPLTDAEVRWCDSTFALAGDSRPETVYEFYLPAPSDLRAAIRSQTPVGEPIPAQVGGLDAVVADADERHRVLRTLQGHLEEEHLRRTKLQRWKGAPIDLDPEWDPDADGTDKSRQHLYDMAAMRRDAHLRDFQTVAGFPYSAFREARARVLDVREPHLDTRDLVALDVAGVPEWTFCRWCGAVAPSDRFLNVERRGSDTGRLRVCDDCADRDPTNLFREGAVAAARDRRAQEYGGQRRFGGEW